jgi:hypothetical protein
VASLPGQHGESMKTRDQPANKMSNPEFPPCSPVDEEEEETGIN